MTRYLLAFVLLVPVFSVQAATIIPSPPQLAAKAWLLIDADSGKVLAENEADLPIPPASLTKMMTAYLLAEEIHEGRVSESDMVRVSENAWSQNPLFKGSSLMWIEPRVPVSIEDLQRGVIISSGNDATVAVAEHVAGSESVFVEMMNATAEKLDMRDTHFVNSHGLPHPAHLTTARDLAILAKAIINNHPDQYAIYKEKTFTYANITQDNRNPLLWEDPSVDGIKTGHTDAAGYCLVSSAERRGMRLISVVMGTSSKSARKNETRALLNYGFRFFETEEVYGPLTELDNARIWKGAVDHVAVGLLDQVVLTLPRGKGQNLETAVHLDDELIAPLAVGDEVGKIILTLDGDTVYRGPLLALEAVEEGGFFSKLWDIVLMWFAGLFRV
jgi:serine-type D-Ala-D-Ala carboxypeptidase (penicillin-binding protein 5/6)